jgi:hypothetical protein
MPNKLFWQIQDDEAKWCRVSRIHVFFCHSDTKLAGFIFEYGNIQVQRHAGHFGGSKASMSLESGEHVTRMDVRTGNSEHELVVSMTRTLRL